MFRLHSDLIEVSESKRKGSGGRSGQLSGNDYLFYYNQTELDDCRRLHSPITVTMNVEGVQKYV